MVNVAATFEVDDEVGLLGWSDRAASKGRVYVKCSCLREGWGVHDYGCYVLERPPITAQGAGVDLRVERSL